MAREEGTTETGAFANCVWAPRRAFFASIFAIAWTLVLIGVWLAFTTVGASMAGALVLFPFGAYMITVVAWSKSLGISITPVGIGTRYPRSVIGAFFFQRQILEWGSIKEVIVFMKDSCLDGIGFYLLDGKESGIFPGWSWQWGQGMELGCAWPHIRDEVIRRNIPALIESTTKWTGIHTPGLKSGADAAALRSVRSSK